MASGDRMPCSMVQRMKPEPASPDQRVPSQSKTATRGARAWTAAWNSAVEIISTAGAGVSIGLILPFCDARLKAPPLPPVLTSQSPSNKGLRSKFVNHTKTQSPGIGRLRPVGPRKVHETLHLAGILGG